jgi:predicted MPP superfamily phosphohydrolase
MLRSYSRTYIAGMNPLDPVSSGEANVTASARARLRLSRRGFLVGGGLVGLSGVSTAGYAAAIEPERLITTTYRVSPNGWWGPRLRMAVIADLHAGGPNMRLEHIRRAIDRTNALAPDVIVLLGDYIATHRFVTERVPYAAWAAEFARLSAPLGVHAILGNHDWWHDVTGVRQAFAKVGIPLLENRAVLLGAGSQQFWLAGLGDQLAYWLGPHKFRGVDDLYGTLSQVTTDHPVILLAHEPDIFPMVPDRVALTLAGHTHGGQIRIPLLWERHVPSRFGTRYVYGHIVESGRHMVVSGGLGTSFVPVRLGVPPEIVQIELGA